MAFVHTRVLQYLWSKVLCNHKVIVLLLRIERFHVLVNVRNAH